MGDCSQRKWQGFSGAILVVAAAALGLASCRVGSLRADALIEPFPDGALDHAAAGEAAGADGGQPCDLLVQICPDPAQACYPVDGVAGATTCQLPGTATVMTGCTSSLQCDRAQACVAVPEAGSQLLCVMICDPSAIDTGCPPKAPCHLISGYRAGYCVP